MRWTLSRRSAQMHFAFDVVSGATLPPAARPRTPGALSAQESTPREITYARSRAAGWEEVVCAHTRRQSARTVEVLVGRGQTPARPRGSPSMQQGGGDHRPHHGGRRRRLLRWRPRALRKRRGWMCRRSKWRRWERGSRVRSSGPMSLFFFPFLVLAMGVMRCLSLSFVCFQSGFGEQETW